MIDLTNLDILLDMATLGIRIVVWLVIGISILYIVFRLAQRVREKVIY